MAYGVAKAGIAHMARCLADEFVTDNITVNCVAPGLVRSASSKPLWENEETLASVSASIPIGRIGEPDDVAAMVVLLASDAGGYITGTTISVDGGKTALSTPGSGLDATATAMSGSTFN